MAEVLRQGDTAFQTPLDIQFVLVDGFSMMALTSAVEPLRAANRLAGVDLFTWTLVSNHAGHAASSSGIEVATRFGFADAPQADLTVVVASFFPEGYNNAALFSRLRRARSAGKTIGAISNGTLILARAGVLGQHRVTVHWENARALELTFPHVNISNELYCRDRNILTAAGGAASMDLFLALIADVHGEALANDVADQFLHGKIRSPSQMQRQDAQWRFRVNDPRLLKALELMQAHMANPKPIPWLAAQIGLSERQLARLFRSDLHMTPSQFYLDLRLRAAHGMIISSTEALEVIAEICGFSSLGHFSRSYKAQFGENPSQARRETRGRYV